VTPRVLCGRSPPDRGSGAVISAADSERGVRRWFAVAAPLLCLAADSPPSSPVSSASSGSTRAAGRLPGNCGQHRPGRYVTDTPPAAKHTTSTHAVNVAASAQADGGFCTSPFAQRP
jgi:hypothetical protein